MKPLAKSVLLSKIEKPVVVVACVGLSLAIAELSALAAVRGILELGLRWSLSPGPVLCLLNLALLTFAVVRFPNSRWYALVSTIFILASAASEYRVDTRSLWILVGVSLLIVAELLALNCWRSSRLWTVGQWLLSTYMLSIFLYNAVNPNEVMTFFSGGVVS